jgi:hypothetical protein
MGTILLGSRLVPGQDVTTLPFAAFTDQATDFAKRLDSELLAKWPELRLNASYQAFRLSGLSA